MGRKDIVTKEYMKDPVRFADAFNQYLYGGEQVIRPERLRELDAEEIVLPYGSDGIYKAVQRYRDALMLVMTDDNMAYCILGIENQGEIHYAMPVKNMMYDSLRLAGQVEETAKMHRAERTTAEAEIRKFRTDLREVMTFLKYASDKKKLAEAVEKDENFKRLDRQTANVINITANANLKYSEEKEDVDMCLAIQQMMEDSERKGKIEGAILAYQSLNLPKQDTISKIAETFRFTQQRAEKEVKKYWT